jgi:hypothetical protein
MKRLISLAPQLCTRRSEMCPRCAVLLLLPRRGFGIVRFPNKEAAEQAVEKMNNATIGGRVVSVRIDRFA